MLESLKSHSTGYIDFSMTIAECEDFNGTGDFIPTDFPSLEELQDVHMRSIRMVDAKDVTFRILKTCSRISGFCSRRKTPARFALTRLSICD